MAPSTVAPTTVAPTTAVPTTAVPTTTTPTTMPPTTVAPITIAPTIFKDPCVNLKRSKCEETCVFGPKKVKECFPKKDTFKHDCAKYKGRTRCREVEVCKFANGRCFHGCEGLAKKKCAKAQFCKNYKVANPCGGCQLVKTCGPSR